MLDFLNPVGNRLDYFLLVDLIRVVNGKDITFHIFKRFLSVQPVLVFFVQSFQVIQRNWILALSWSFLDSLLTYLGWTTDINNPRKVNYLLHLQHVFIALQVNFILSLVQDLHVLHDAGENESVAQQRSLWNPDSVALESAVLSPFLQPAHERINLEGEAPTLGIFVVDFEEVDVLVATDILPVA